MHPVLLVGPYGGDTNFNVPGVTLFEHFHKLHIGVDIWVTEYSKNIQIPQSDKGNKYTPTKRYVADKARERGGGGG